MSNSSTEAATMTDTPVAREGNLLQRYSRMVSTPNRSRFYLTLSLNAVGGALRGASLVALLPTAVSLATGEPSWGLGIWGWVAVLAAIGLLGAITEYAAAMIGYRVALDMIETVHGRLGNRLSRLPLGWFRATASGRLSRLVSKELLMLGESVAHTLAEVVSGVTTAIVVVIGSWIWDWRLGLVLTVAAPLFGIALRFAQRLLAKGKTISEPAERELGDRIVEYARCQGSLRSCGRAGSYEPLQQATTASLAAQRKDLWWGLGANLLHGIAGQAIVVTMIVVAAKLALAGDMGPVQTIAFIGLSLRFMQVLEAAGSKLMGIEERRPMLDHVDEILDAPVLAEPQESRSAATAGAIELEDVNFSYSQNTPVLSDVSFTVAPGTMCALVGPSGSGKTTIAKLIARFYDTDQGTVRVGGIDVRDQTTDDLMRQLSMVFQDVYLFDDSLIENIRIGNPMATDEQVHHAADLAGVTEIVNRLPQGWETRVGEGGRSLSGGERQRVSVARALLKNAPIVLLDEATSSLDPENEANVAKALQTLRQNSTLLVIAHKLDTIQSADQIIVLDNAGQVTQHGTHSELIELPGRYRDFWQARSKATQWRFRNRNN